MGGDMAGEGKKARGGDLEAIIKYRARRPVKPTQQTKLGWAKAMHTYQSTPFKKSWDG